MAQPIRKKYGMANDMPGAPRAVVFYHGDCADGFGAAWAIHAALSNASHEMFGDKWFSDGAEALYVPIQYDTRVGTVTAVADELPGAHVYVVDFSFTPQALLGFLSEFKAASVTWIDHHATAFPFYEDLQMARATLPPATLDKVTAVFDQNHSGAILTWHHMHPGLSAPLFLDHIEDRDLWRFALPGTKEVCAAVYSYEFDLDLWDSFGADELVGSLALEGAALGRQRTKDIDGHCRKEQLRFVTLDGHKAIEVNAPWYVCSELGQTLLERYPEADIAMVYLVGSDRIKYSLRARKDGVNVAELAEKIGGGGHPAAAGFVITDEWEVQQKFNELYQVGW